MTSLEDQTLTALPMLPPRRPESHKGDFGRALVVGGSCGMSGAIAMAGLATLRGGAGLVTLAVPRCVQNVAAAISPCYMSHGLADANGMFMADAAAEVLELGKAMNVLALGPGVNRSPPVAAFVQRLYREVPQPMVVDADALFALAETADILQQAGGPRVLTPHPGEFARLVGKVPLDDERVSAAAELARRDPSANTVVVLKGYHTVVTDGGRFSLNHTGNPGMATGGSGDVLTGVITALLCQGLAPFEAARLGVHVHGLAGDLAAAEFGQVSLIATDLIDYLPRAFRGF